MGTLRDHIADVLEAEIHASDWSEYEDLPDVLLADPVMRSIIGLAAGDIDNWPDDNRLTPQVRALLEDWRDVASS